DRCRLLGHWLAAGRRRRRGPADRWPAPVASPVCQSAGLAAMTISRLRVPRLRLDPRWWMLALAIVAGLVAAWAAQHHLRTLAARLEAAARQPMRAVVVAAVDLPADTQLDAHRVAVRDMPAEW